MAQDFPWDDVLNKAMDLIKQGRHIRIYQKFTCSGCGARLTMEQPNKFFETGTCDKCPAITNIKAQGCNFLIHAGGVPNAE